MLDDIIRRCEERLASGEQSMIRMLLEARDPETGDKLDREALRNEAAVIFMAGHETTANSLAWTWFLLSQAPEVEERLHAELAEVLGGRLPTLDDVPRLIYTRAVFEEAIRLYPPVPLLGRQALARRDDPQPADPRPGSLLVVIPWLLHRHRQLWDQPDHFIPERFLPENAAVAPALQLHPVQRRAAGLRRPGLRPDRGDPVPRHPGAAGPAAPRPGGRRRADLPVDACGPGDTLPMLVEPRG